jgi:polysaccharide pyruvyl transferase CsaB
MKICIIGAYGCGNVGDEAILEGMLTKLYQTYPNANIKVFALNEQYIQNLFFVDTVSQVLTRGLSWRVIKDFNFKGMLRAIYKSDMVMIGGGSLIHERTKYNLLYFYSLALWAKATGSKICFVGLSVSKIKSQLGKFLAKRLLSLGEYITVRDEVSFSNVKALNPPTQYCLSWDLAFLNPESSLTKLYDHYLEFPKGYIAINICAWFRSEEYWHPNPQLQMQRKVKVAQLIDQLIHKYNKKIVLLNTVTPTDSAVCYEILKYIKNKNFVSVIDQELTPYTMKKVIALADILIGMRLHSLIFSTIVGTPFVAFNYDDKVKSFVERLGIQDIPVLEIEELNNTSFLLEVIEEVWSRHEWIQKKLNEVTQQFHLQVWKEEWNI